MKANELSCKDLMVGDWVKPKNVDVSFKVGLIGVDSVWNHTDTHEWGYDELEPIPLTQEILEKNGWKYNDEDAKFFPKTWVGGGLKLQDADGGSYRIVVTSDYDDEDTNDTPFIILYVHELQHVLRLCGIEKVIKP